MSNGTRTSAGNVKPGDQIWAEDQWWTVLSVERVSWDVYIRVEDGMSPFIYRPHEAVSIRPAKVFPKPPVPMFDALGNSVYISEEDAAKNCAAGFHDWSLFGEGPAAFCLHCAATRRNVNAPVIPAPKPSDDVLSMEQISEMRRYVLSDHSRFKSGLPVRERTLQIAAQALFALARLTAENAGLRTQRENLRAENAALKAERDGLKIELALVPTAINNWNGDAFRVDPAVRDTPASNGTTELETRLNTDTPRTIDRSELGAAVDLMAQGKVQPREGVDFVKMPAPRPPSKRKPHSGNAGYVAELKNKRTGKGYVVIYDSTKTDIDNGWRWVVVCEEHHTMVGCRSLRRARQAMKDVDFCEQCAALRNADEEARKS